MERLLSPVELLYRSMENLAWSPPTEPIRKAQASRTWRYTTSSDTVSTADTVESNRRISGADSSLTSRGPRGRAAFSMRARACAVPMTKKESREAAFARITRGGRDERDFHGGAEESDCCSRNR